MPQRAKRKQRKCNSKNKRPTRGASGYVSGDTDSSSDWDGATPKKSTKKAAYKPRKTKARPAKKRPKKQSRNKSKDAEDSATTVHDLSTPDRKKPNEGVDVDYGYGSDGEETLHGPCGDPTFGQDPPPARLRKLIGEHVAPEFEVDGHADLVLFTGVVETYNQTTDKFTVRILLILITILTLSIN